MTNDGADAVSGTGAELLARFRLGPSPSHGGGRGWQAAISCPAARAPVPPGPPSGPAAGIGHLIVMAEGAGDPVRTSENIARLGAEVLPAWRERVSSRPAPGAG